LKRPKTPNVYASSPLTGREYFNGIAASSKRLLNLNNPQDYALGRGWRFNQKYKPDIGWGYSTAETFYRVESTGTHTKLLFPGDRGEIFAHGAQASSDALGRVDGVAGMISVDLAVAPFSFSGDSSNHSAEFNSTIMLRASFWARLLAGFKSDN
jgi:hypothetical protein